MSGLQKRKNQAWLPLDAFLVEADFPLQFAVRQLQLAIRRLRHTGNGFDEILEKIKKPEKIRHNR